MAHNIATSTDGRPCMAYFGKRPWHGLGTRLENPATAAEAMKAANLDFKIELQDLVTIGLIDVPMRKAVVRTDTKKTLAVTGCGYRPFQNSECFSFLDQLVGDGQVEFHTVGALGHGERVWMLAKLPGIIQIGTTEDITEKFILLSNSHDGTSSLRIFFSPIRVVCQNTLMAAERRSKGQGVTIRHTGDLHAKSHEARAVLGIANRFYDSLQVRVNHLAAYLPKKSELENYFATLFPDPKEGSKTRAENTRREIFRLFEEGKGQQIPGVKNTAWAAFNAVTEYIDHFRPTRAKSELERRSRRLESQWFGSGAKVKAEAWNLALEMTTAG